MTDLEEIKALLTLQQEIDDKVDEFITRIKAVLASERDGKGKHRIIAELDGGEIVELVKTSLETQVIDMGRKHHGFFHDYRFVRLGKPLK
jgi:hypothetical protein